MTELQVIRKVLSAGEVSPANQRYVNASDLVQITYDGGQTWSDYPQGDPRHGVSFVRPVLGSQCGAAAGMVKWLKDYIDAVESILSTIGTVTAVAYKLLDFLTFLSDGYTLLFERILEVAGTLSDIGYLALVAAFDQTTYDQLLCIFYCSIGSDGSVNASQLSSIETQVSADLNANAAIVVNAILGAQGEVGLSNAGVFENQTGDCSGCTSCGWCYLWQDADWPQWTLTTDIAWVKNEANDQNVTQVVQTPGSNGWAGSGYSQSHIPVSIDLDFGETVALTQVSYHGSGGGTVAARFFTDADNFANPIVTSFGTHAVNVSCSKVRVFVYAYSNPLLSDVSLQGDSNYPPFSDHYC